MGKQQNSKWLMIKEYCSKNITNLVLLFISLVFFFVVIGLAGINFFSRLSIELCEGFKDDGGIYYAVGKGIAHGLLPYVDMYETKGPVLFYLCALAYMISPNFIFMNILAFCSLLLIFIAPIIIITYRFVHDNNYKGPAYLSFVFCFFSIGLLLAAYTQDNCGRGYAEMYALGFLIVYFMLMYMVDSKNLKLYSPTVIISSIFLMLSIFTKETFAFMAIVGGLFICKNKKDFLFKFFVPFLYAGIIAIVFMGSVGILPAYFNIYLKSMIDRKIPPTNFLYSSNVLENVPNYFRIDIILKSIWDFSNILTILLMLAFAISYYWLFTQQYHKKNMPILSLDIARRLALALASFFVTTFCVSLGNITWAHQRPIGVPLYLLMLFISSDVLYSLKDIKFESSKLTITTKSVCSLALCVTTCIGIYFIPRFNYDSRTYADKTNDAKAQATYVDEVCDALNENRYQYIGFISNRFYAYTKHDPMGPAFVQTDAMFKYESNYLCQQFIIQIQTVNVVFAKSYRCGAIDDWVKLYVSTHFTSKVPEKCKNIEKPSSWTGATLFRIGKFN